MDNEAFKAKYPKLAKQLEENPELKERYKATTERLGKCLRHRVEPVYRLQQQIERNVFKWKEIWSRWGKFARQWLDYYERLHPDDAEIIDRMGNETAYNLFEYLRLLDIASKAPAWKGRLFKKNNLGLCIKHDVQDEMLKHVFAQLGKNPKAIRPWVYNQGRDKAAVRDKFLEQFPMVTPAVFMSIWKRMRKDLLITEISGKSRR
jgi:hypothetical protein